MVLYFYRLHSYISLILLEIQIAKGDQYMKLGVVGTSSISDSFLKASKHIEDIEFDSVMSPRQTNVDRFIEKYGFRCGYVSYNKFIMNSDIDLVYIASPNIYHFEQTKQALLQHKNVICEKPITLSLDDLEELERIADANDVFFIEAMRPVHHPHIKIIRESIKKLGLIRYVSLGFMRYSSKYKEYQKGGNPRVFSKEYGGGALNDLGVYPITLAVLLFGPPKKVTSNSMSLNTEVDLITRITMQYDTFIVNCVFSKISNSFVSNEIQGECRSLLLSHVTHLDRLELIGNRMSKVLFNERLEDDMRFEIEAISSMVLTKDVIKFKEFLNIAKDVTTICDTIRSQINGEQIKPLQIL